MLAQPPPLLSPKTLSVPPPADSHIHLCTFSRLVTGTAFTCLFLLCTLILPDLLPSLAVPHQFHPRRTPHVKRPSIHWLFADRRVSSSFNFEVSCGQHEAPATRGRGGGGKKQELGRQDASLAAPETRHLPSLRQPPAAVTQRARDIPLARTITNTPLSYSRTVEVLNTHNVGRQIHRAGFGHRWPRSR